MAEREGLIVEELVQPGRELSEQTILLLQKQEHDYLIARVGLQGTLSGACGCLLVIVLIVGSQSWTPQMVITGWQIVVVVAIMVGAIVFYGTFIFKRALAATGHYGTATFSLTSPHAAPDHPKVVLQGERSRPATRDKLSAD